VLKFVGVRPYCHGIAPARLNGQVKVSSKTTVSAIGEME